MEDRSKTQFDDLVFGIWLDESYDERFVVVIALNGLSL